MTDPNTSQPLFEAGQDPASSPSAPALDPAANSGAESGTPTAPGTSDLESRHAELSDAFLRAKAEAENLRRRAEEDLAKA